MNGITFEEAPTLDALVAGPADYFSFVEALEVAHGVPHDAIGAADLAPQAAPGDMADLRVSPGDPAFYLHHAFVDKLWADRQAGGRHPPAEYSGWHSGRLVSTRDVLRPFNARVSDLLRLPCVRYAPPGGGADAASGRPRRGRHTRLRVSRAAAGRAVAAARARRDKQEADWAHQAGATPDSIVRAREALLAAATTAYMNGDLELEEGGGGTPTPTPVAAMPAWTLPSPMPSASELATETPSASPTPRPTPSPTPTLTPVVRRGGLGGRGAAAMPT